ncbi:hypothetical protein [Ramlibacter tataouinensis]|uniref:PIN domain-containing protein n=1 Tax=Ramlibacter tataouinensis (strain ATCC BAA-407 / DSM 14655 / LMG 21543 / TTB310) TaxID=365046 RepID=F5Y4P1_RAMTT|nr:hypothetical protein [Ramlibacter tataouinensis]AEG91359.1 Hypothetical protein Rta_02915 [Ramlibacter tataouinensis TTB310]
MRVLLDSNVWRYIVDEDAVFKIRRAVRAGPHQILVAPAVVYEAFRASDEDLRMRLLDALTDPNWKRMMPEAYSEAEELLSEVRRLRPAWLREDPDLTLHRRLRFDWKRSRGGFWDRARHQSNFERFRVDVADAGILERAQAEAYEIREQAKEMPLKFGTVPLADLRGRFGERANNWDGEDFEPWRYAAMTIWMVALSMERHTYQEWLEGVVLLPLLSVPSADLTKFWLRDVQAARMPRTWLRFALEFQQRFHRVTDGTPADSQLVTYLVDADLFLSADKNFVRMAQRCKAEAPISIASAELVPAGSAAVDTVLRKISR